MTHRFTGSVVGRQLLWGEDGYPVYGKEVTTSRRDVARWGILANGGQRLVGELLGGDMIVVDLGASPSLTPTFSRLERSLYVVPGASGWALVFGEDTPRLGVV